MHVLTLLRGDTVRPAVSILLLEDSFRVEAPRVLARRKHIRGIEGNARRSNPI